jgi:hypothetical protein
MEPRSRISLRFSTCIRNRHHPRGGLPWIHSCNFHSRQPEFRRRTSCRKSGCFLYPLLVNKLVLRMFRTPALPIAPQWFENSLDLWLEASRLPECDYYDDHESTFESGGKRHGNIHTKLPLARLTFQEDHGSLIVQRLELLLSMPNHAMRVSTTSWERVSCSAE